MAAGSLVQQYCEETTCPICLEYFTDPVTTHCGHNFCRACLTRSWRGLGRNATCPECRAPAQQSSLRPNRKLANIAEISKTCSLQQAKGVCRMHQEPLKLFCKYEEALICTVCHLSKDHREHPVIPAEEAADEYEEKIPAQLMHLMFSREQFVSKKKSGQETSQTYLRKLKAEKQEITSVFEQMHKYLQEMEHLWLTELADVEKEVKKKQEEYVTKLSEEISQFDNLIKDVKLKCQQQPPRELLQDIRCIMNRCLEKQEKTPPALSLGLEWRLRSNLQKSAILKKAMQEFKGLLRRAQSTAVNVTLDSDTAHPRLILSEDLKSVFCEGINLKPWDKPERFDAMPFVLGCERFTSGKFFWEVEALKGKGWWAVGVARESLRRKGFIRVGPNVGIWAVANASADAHQVWALTSPNHTRVALRSRLKKIRVFVDYEEGHVKFFNADTEDVIYTYPSASFSGEGVTPFFWVDGGGCLQC